MPATELHTDAQRPRIFYGWWIVAGAVVGQFVAVGASFGSAGVFLDPMTEELGWSRGQFTVAASGAAGVGGIAGFFIGPLIDRYGARILMICGAIVLSTALYLISHITELWQFIALQLLGVGLGQALVGPLVVNITLSKWFVVRRGWAIALGSIGISLASITVPFLLTRIVDTNGWRDGYVALSAGVLLLIIPVALIMRRQPEDYGLLPDGIVHRTQEAATAGDKAATLDRLNSYTRHEALRTPAIWLLTLSFGCFAAGTSGVLLHGIPFVTDAGFTRSEAALAFSFAGVANLLSKFAWGYTLARFHVRMLWAASFACLIGGLILMLFADSTDTLPLMFGAFFLWGLGFGGGVPLSEFIWAKYFGRVHIGAVRSVGMPFSIAFGAAGPIGIAVFVDATDSYIGPWIVLAAVYGIGATAVLISREPPPKVSSSEVAAST